MRTLDRSIDALTKSVLGLVGTVQQARDAAINAVQLARLSGVELRELRLEVERLRRAMDIPERDAWDVPTPSAPPPSLAQERALRRKP